ncbi:NADPH-dependent FMN reductase [uncultured Roseburia sp.]|uniref:Flavodoxin family protein n=1 Tax=Brotonthovivens ammoniilytica TaxID=2981725 RepID=A0ABT2TGY0_9FIRM|nr:flavodoxin family protein [Brotonthovivens ammoniilytica]MCU6760844.1 flavodoxin family protein [Brotonthovivens ammoniilytica]SCI11010.1 NADPH-dependent FMN reductase [uncultured Roseburia sp.]
MKKITAFCAGRRNGNSETFTKAALMAAEQAGVEVELIRLNECDLKPCLGCPTAPCLVKGPDCCPHHDDGAWLVEKLLDCDGYLMAAPVWCLSPAGIVSVFRDRVIGPKLDPQGFKMFGRVPEWVKGRVKERPGALISVGGAGTENWTSLGLPTLYTTTFTPQTNVVDHMNVTEVADMGAAVLRDDLIERAKNLGEHLAYAVLHMDEEPAKWMGDDTPTACPNCHQNLLIMHPGTNQCECAVCGKFGTVSMTDNKLSFVFEDTDINDRLAPAGKLTHGQEIFRIKREIYEPNKEKIPEKWQPYKDYNACITTAPSRQKA